VRALISVYDKSGLDEFARGLFTVWFGPDPGDANLKSGMLGK